MLPDPPEYWSYCWVQRGGWNSFGFYFLAESGTSHLQGWAMVPLCHLLTFSGITLTLRCYYLFSTCVWLCISLWFSTHRCLSKGNPFQSVKSIFCGSGGAFQTLMSSSGLSQLGLETRVQSERCWHFAGRGGKLQDPALKSGRLCLCNIKSDLFKVLKGYSRI